MDLIKIAEEIQSKNREIDSIRGVIKERGEQAAVAEAEYEKKLAVTLLKMRNDEEFIFEGVDISQKNVPANILEKYARGVCWKEKLEKEKAAALFKSAQINMNAAVTQMTALQSLFRYLKEA